MSISVLNTDEGLSGKTIANLESTQTITGQKTFDRDPNAPFLVSAGSAVVANLDADKLDGQEGAYYLALANHTGSIPGASLAAAYPVGSIYFNAAVATNPATLLGFGTWAAFGAGRMLVGFNAADADFDVVEETGGAKTHTLTTAEMPAHDHGLDFNSGGTGSGSTAIGAAHDCTPVVSDNHGPMSNTGGGGAHNNMPPYITVYMWKRTA